MPLCCWGGLFFHHHRMCWVNAVGALQATSDFGMATMGVLRVIRECLPCTTLHNCFFYSAPLTGAGGGAWDGQESCYTAWHVWP
jgi:hypothetical protein